MIVEIKEAPETVDLGSIPFGRPCVWGECILFKMSTPTAIGSDIFVCACVDPDGCVKFADVHKYTLVRMVKKIHLKVEV